MPHPHSAVSSGRRLPTGSPGAHGPLEEALARLAEIRSLVVVAAAALRQQNCELDEDIARLLQRGVAGGIAEQIERLRRL